MAKHSFLGWVRRRCFRDLPVDGTLEIEFPTPPSFPTSINSVVTSLKDAVSITSIPAPPSDLNKIDWLTLLDNQIAVISYHIWDTNKETERFTTVHFGPRAVIPYRYSSKHNPNAFHSDAKSGYIITLK